MSKHGSNGLSHQGLVARGIVSSHDDDDNEDSSGPIPNWIEFRTRIRKELKEMNIDELWEILHILIREINDRWNMLSIENRKRKNK